MDSVPLLEMRGISKRFPGVVALDQVSLSVGKGEVLALCGENGAGKSTLMKILGGVYHPEEGELRVDGKRVEIRNVNDSMDLGIGFIHQELNVLDNLDIAANIFLGREPLIEPFKIINRKKIHADTEPLLKRLGLNTPSTTLLRDLSIAQQQMVEIAKALSLNARIIIMDEPTSSLTLTETDRLLEVIAELRGQGVSIIYISHRLGEVSHCADRVEVLRDGKNAGGLAKADINHDNIVAKMVGREIKNVRVSSEAKQTPGYLKVRNARSSRYPGQSVSFDAGRGEILGFAGLVGAGRSEMIKAMVGLDERGSAEVTLGDKSLEIRTARASIGNGIFLVPEDRRGEGLVTAMTVRENTTLPSLVSYSTSGLISKARETAAANEQITALRIKTPGPEALIRNLSGGNQQKVAIGKWLAMSPKVLILDEPTRGIDVGAKAEIYKLVRSLANGGAVIIIISSDMEEVLHLSDRIAVMHEGRITGMLDQADCNEQNIMQLAVGRPVSAAKPAFPLTNSFMKKELGIFILLVALCVATAAKNPNFLSTANLTNLANAIGMFGIFSLGIGLVIITGGIDLSVGSMCALSGVLLSMALREWNVSWPLATLMVISVLMLLGWVHGTLVTKMKMQPFIVTLCGLLIYRGLAQYIAKDNTKGFGNAKGFEALQSLASGKLFNVVPMPFVWLSAIGGILWVVLHRSVYGRYLLAAGRNEEAARFSGINTRRVITGSYVIAGLLTCISGIMFAFYTNSVQASNHGNFYELYAIAAAVLGGCSLRGGEGSIIGIIIGTALLQVLQNLVNLLGIPSSLNFAVMGAVVLLGVMADQTLQRRAAAK